MRYPFSRAVPGAASTTTPYDFGYSVAKDFRIKAGIGGTEPIASLEDAAAKIAGRPFRLEDRNHLPGNDLRAIVGWSPADEAVIAGPQKSIKSSRFLLARGIFHALFSCAESHRLVTTAFTWDQQASRAFAAEFLAPRQGLLARIGSGEDPSLTENLAREYRVSPRLINHQLENAGFNLPED